MLFKRDERFLALRRGRWGLGWAVLGLAAGAGVFFLGSLTVWLVVQSLSAGLAGDVAFNVAMSPDIGPMVGNPYTLLNFLILGTVLPVSVWVAARLQAQRLTDFIWLEGTFRWSHFWRMAAAFWLVLLMSSPILFLFYADDVVFRPGAFANPVFLAASIAVIAVQTFGEELVFRGYLFRVWGGLLLRPVLTAVLWAVAFALLHVDNPDVRIDPVPALLSLILFALFAQWLVSRTGALDAAWGLHFATNISGFLIIQMKPGYDSDASLIIYTDRILAEGGSYAFDLFGYLVMFGGFAAMWLLVTQPRSPFFIPGRDSIT
jgi:membrane protease YdiL (CAAX protease family)